MHRRRATRAMTLSIPIWKYWRFRGNLLSKNTHFSIFLSCGIAEKSPLAGRSKPLLHTMHKSLLASDPAQTRIFLSILTDFRLNAMDWNRFSAKISQKSQNFSEIFCLLKSVRITEPHTFFFLPIFRFRCPKISAQTPTLSGVFIGRTADCFHQILKISPSPSEWEIWWKIQNSKHGGVQAPIGRHTAGPWRKAGSEISKNCIKKGPRP